MDYGDVQLEEKLKQQQAQNSDASFNVRFYLKALENKYQSELQGRPIYDEVEFIEIRNPGDNWSVINRKVNKQSVGGNLPDHLRWPAQYKAFLDGEEPPVSGTPLSEWQLLPRTTAESLRHMGIKTLEQLASLPEHVTRDVIDGIRLRAEAEKHLNQSAKQIDMNKLIKRVELLEAENLALRNNLSVAMQEKEMLSSRNVVSSNNATHSDATLNLNIEEMVKQQLTKALESLNINGAAKGEAQQKHVKIKK